MSGGIRNWRVLFTIGIVAFSSLAIWAAAPANQTGLIWDGDAAKTGLKSFNTAQPINGEITIIDDPKLGKVYQILCHDAPDGKSRSELSGMRGFTPSNTGTYYFGWAQKWGPLPTKKGKWQVLQQIHLAGKGAPGGPVPLGLSAPGDGNMYLNLQDPKGKSTSVWSHPLPLSEWHTWVYCIKYSETMDNGYLMLWYDGKPQTFINNKTQIPCAMAHPDSTSYWKWGVYRSGEAGKIGDSYAYLWRPRAGNSYADVDPNNP